LIVTLKVFLAVRPFESVTTMVRVAVPCAVGVPEIVSVLEVLDPRLSPSGDELAASVHVKGATPPASLTLAL
jgi:hypothetical protein